MFLLLLKSRPGTETLKQQHKGCLLYAITQIHFVILFRFKRSLIYHIKPLVAKLQKHVQDIYTAYQMIDSVVRE